VKELVIVSGKGGTGKTSMVAAFAALAGNAVLADCDVDAADLHLILKPDIKYREDFTGGKAASIRIDDCVGCGKCFELCRFGAISKITEDGQDKFVIDPVGCEGCGVCYAFCPVEAIDYEEKVNGELFISDTRFGPMVHARLGIAEENSGKLVTLVRKNAKRIAEEEKRELIIVDGSPGIGCSVIASIAGSDTALIVSEPTLSGLHDLKRVIQLAMHFGVRALLCINKFDINPRITGEIEKTAGAASVPTVGKIPYDDAFTKAQVQGQSIVEYENGALSENIKKIWDGILQNLRKT